MQYACSTCHFGLDNNSPGHANGTGDVVFDPGSIAYPFGADAGLTPTYDSGTKTCDNVYCHSNGRNAFRGHDAVNGEEWSPSRNWGSQAGTFATTPAWDAPLNTINDCDFCHAGNGVMTAPYTFSQADNIVMDAPPTNKHTSSSHYSNAANLAFTGWSSTQCFWCHNTQNGSWASSGMLQGTYGTNLHVDGATHFNPQSYQDQPYGTMVNGPDASTPYDNSTAGGHCGAGKTCW